MDSMRGDILSPGSVVAVKSIEKFLRVADPTVTLTQFPYKVKLSVHSRS